MSTCYAQGEERGQPLSYALPDVSPVTGTRGRISFQAGEAVAIVVRASSNLCTTKSLRPPPKMKESPGLYMAEFRGRLTYLRLGHEGQGLASKRFRRFKKNKLAFLGGKTSFFTEFLYPL